MSNPDFWQFPCEFPIKIVGKANPEFEATVLATIRKHVPDLREDCIETRTSKEGAYLAITVKVMAESKEQLDAIYQDLSSNDNILMVL